MVINAYLNKQKFQIITSYLKDLKISDHNFTPSRKKQTKVMRRYEIMKSSEIKDLKKHETKSRFFKLIKWTNFWLD